MQEEQLWSRGAKNSIALLHGVQPAVGVDFLSRGGSATDIKAYTKTRISTEVPHEHAYFWGGASYMFDPSRRYAHAVTSTVGGIILPVSSWAD